MVGSLEFMLHLFKNRFPVSQSVVFQFGDCICHISVEFGEGYYCYLTPWFGHIRDTLDTVVAC